MENKAEDVFSPRQGEFRKVCAGEFSGTTATSGTVPASTTAVWSRMMSKGGGFIVGGTTAEALTVVISIW